METNYAPPYRSSRKDIISNFQFINSQPDISALLNALPYFVTILDANRQIVFLNSALKSFLNMDAKASIGKRPGELVNCIYSNEMKYGCGTSKNCKFCGAVNSILESQVSDKMITKDCRIVSSQGDSWTNFEFSVSSSSIKINEKRFTLFSLIDISDKKRRYVLEKIFFHDIINSAGALNGVLNYLRENEKDKDLTALLNVASNVSRELIDEILSQKQVLEAENNELIIDLKPCNSIAVMNAVVDTMSNHSVSEEKKISVDNNSVNLDFISDERIVKRILINMVKNALEAIRKGEQVLLRASLEGDNIVFSSNNPGLIPDDIQLQIFQRSFSTKGENRGIGAYSMKLHTEKYLKGKLYFTSDKNGGTTFYCELPMREVKGVKS
ncbi:MAG: ATP-binding protein [Tenuifilaceae bacterium]